MHLAYMQVMWRQKISSCLTDHNYSNYLGEKESVFVCVRECTRERGRGREKGGNYIR